LQERGEFELTQRYSLNITMPMGWKNKFFIFLTWIKVVTILIIHNGIFTVRSLSDLHILWLFLYETAIVFHRSLCPQDMWVIT